MFSPSQEFIKGAIQFFYVALFGELLPFPWAGFMIGRGAVGRVRRG